MGLTSFEIKKTEKVGWFEPVGQSNPVYNFKIFNLMSYLIQTQTVAEMLAPALYKSPASLLLPC
jgi:hypothetical protein